MPPFAAPLRTLLLLLPAKGSMEANTFNLPQLSRYSGRATERAYS